MSAIAVGCRIETKENFFGTFASSSGISLCEAVVALLKRKKITKMNRMIRNMVVLNPAAMLCGAGLGMLFSHRAGACAALAMSAVGMAVAFLPAFGRLVDRHTPLAFGVAAAAWLFAAGRVGWFVARVCM